MSATTVDRNGDGAKSTSVHYFGAVPDLVITTLIHLEVAIKKKLLIGFIHLTFSHFVIELDLCFPLFKGRIHYLVKVVVTYFFYIFVAIRFTTVTTV